jgi:hypothetical protein
LPRAAPAPRPSPLPVASPAALRFPSFDPLTLFQPRPSVRPGRDSVPRNRPGDLSSFEPLARPGAKPAPLTRVQPEPVGSCGPCSTKRTQRERKRKCSNPRVSTKRETRGGSEYLITTRKITCPSSRKKPR